jgi:hypothetical protein
MSIVFITNNCVAVVGGYSELLTKLPTANEQVILVRRFFALFIAVLSQYRDEYSVPNLIIVADKKSHANRHDCC